MHNEIAAYRASKYAGTEHEYQYTVFMDPKEQLEKAAEIEAEDQFQEDGFEGLLSMVF